MLNWSNCMNFNLHIILISASMSSADPYICIKMFGSFCWPQHCRALKYSGPTWRQSKWEELLVTFPSKNSITSYSKISGCIMFLLLAHHVVLLECFLSSIFKWNIESNSYSVENSIMEHVLRKILQMFIIWKTWWTRGLAQSYLPISTILWCYMFFSFRYIAKSSEIAGNASIPGIKSLDVLELSSQSFQIKIISS